VGYSKGKGGSVKDMPACETNASEGLKKKGIGSETGINFFKKRQLLALVATTRGV